MDDEWDLVVIGSGAGGLSAAVSAAEGGCRVLVFESEREFGGSMALSGGVFCAAGTSVQSALGLEDSPELYYRHYMDLNQWVLRPGLIRTFCYESTPTFEWLLGMGLEVPPHLSENSHQPGIRKLGVEVPRRGHIPVGEGYALAQVLERARKDRGVELVLGTRVERLLIENGRVTGVVADDVEVRVPAVVVASGGFARNDELLARLFPRALRAGADRYVVAGQGSRGDHVAFADQVGAAIVGEDWGSLLIGAYFQRDHHWQSGFPPVARVLVDGTGRRYSDEDAPYSVAVSLMEAIGGHAWMVFDEAGRRGLPPGYPAWSPEPVQAEADAGRTHRAGDLRTLAGMIGADPDTLVATLERWNETLPNGYDPEFLRHESLAAYGYPTPARIAEPPFYAVRTLPIGLIVTQAGLQIDEHARVIDRFGRVIPGLYAAGEAAGGILGPHYIGATSIASALTMGRRAGHHASGRSER
ncbi:FAD-dependent oxidoreductase [Pseudonocardia sp. CA-107938]|uniref:FAD-dependent oxidoreductase n=1 Tax=Pseudonocardia sp. CA-107938 TaxID=3240021 RepID=UPI003D93E500